MVRELGSLQVKVQEELVAQVKDTLQVEDVAIINAHDTYQERKVLFDHMGEEIRRREAKVRHRTSRTDKKLSAGEEAEIYSYHTGEIEKMTAELANRGETPNPEKGMNIVEEETIKVEDRVCARYGIKPY